MIYLEQINKVEKIATLSKVRRMFNNPYKYVASIIFWKLIYPWNKKEINVYTNLFYDKKIKISLPASIDIYLTGGKSHNSEIRLGKFLIQHLSKGMEFLDVGANCGYFTMIASELVGKEGKVIAFEPGAKCYKLLTENCSSLHNVTTIRKALSNETGKLIFYEFPNLYSEYSSVDILQFEKEPWFKGSEPLKIEVDSTTIDEITKENIIHPQVIKIDVEGGEYNVIEGGKTYLKNHSPVIIMEYLEPHRNNGPHKKALELLLNLGFKSHIISQSGNLEAISDIDHYLISKNLESDNIVFCK